MLNPDPDRIPHHSLNPLVAWEVYKHQLEAAQAEAKSKLKAELHSMQNDKIRLEEKLAQGKERESWLQLEVTWETLITCCTEVLSGYRLKLGNNYLHANH